MSVTNEGPGVARLADPARSRAVLIGPSEFASLPDLPAVEQNLQELRRLLTDPMIWGLPEDNCVVIGQDVLTGPGGATEVMRAVNEAARDARDALVVYYAGHGLEDPTDHRKLRLAMPASKPDQRFSSLGYEDIRDELSTAKRVKRLVILDCCFAGLAMRDGMGAADAQGSKDFAKRASAPGAYLLAAAAATDAAVSPPGEPFTAFSGELFRLLREGAADGPEVWGVVSLFDRLHAALADRGRPLPELLDHNRGADLLLARNVGFRSELALAPPLASLLKAQVMAADRFMYQLVGAHRSMVEVYVRQDLRGVADDRQPDGAEAGKKAAPRPVAGPPGRIQEAIRQHVHLTVTGGPGLGKSTQSVQLAAEMADQWLSASGMAYEAKIIPIRVVASVVAADDSPFDRALVHAAQSALGHAADSTLPPDLLDLAPPDSTWLVLVDGLDEIADARVRERFINLLRSRSRDKNEKIRLLLLTRPLPPRELIGFGAPGSRYFLQPFDTVRLTEFAHAWFSEQDALPGGFLDQVQAASLSELVQVPLLATIAAIAYESQPHRPLPSNRYGLYEQYLSYLATEKAEDAKLQWKRLEKRLSVLSLDDRLAAASLFQRRMELVRHLAGEVADGETDLIEAAMRWLAEETGAQVSVVAEWRHHIVSALNSTGLFSYESGELAFIHASFGDHLAADARARLLPAPFDRGHLAWENVISQALSNYGDKSRATLVHYAYRHPKDFALLGDLQGDEKTGLLAGHLLAEGVPALAAHYERFLSSLRAVVEGDSGSAVDEWLGVAGRLNNLAIHDYLRTLAADAAYSTSMHIRAAVALRGVDDELAVRTLRSYLHGAGAADDPFWAVDMQEAGIALVGFGPEYMPEVVRAFLTGSDLDDGMRSGTVEVLSGLRPQQVGEAIAVLRDLLADPNRGIRERAAVALVLVEPSAGGEVVESLILSQDENTGDLLDEVFARIPFEHGPGVLGVLERLMHDSDPQVRITAGLTAARWNVASALGTLLRDDDPQVWSQAVENIDWSLTRDTVVDAFDVEDFSMLERMAQRFTALRPERVGVLGRTLVGDAPLDDVEESLHYVDILRAFGPTLVDEALEILSELMTEDDPQARATVVETIVTLALTEPKVAGRAVAAVADQIPSMDHDAGMSVVGRLVNADDGFVREHLYRVWLGYGAWGLQVFGLVLSSVDEPRREMLFEILESDVQAGRLSASDGEMIRQFRRSFGSAQPGPDPVSDVDPAMVDWATMVVDRIRGDLARLGPDEMDLAVVAIRDRLAQWDGWPVDEVLVRLAATNRGCARAVALAFPASVRTRQGEG